MIRAIIIDDEKRARETINHRLATYCKSVLVVAEAADIKTGIELITNHKPDLVFLDINLSGESGFDLLTQIDRVDFKLIFITAYHEYAIKAFKFSALDYLLKPINPDELVEAVNKVQTQLEKENVKTNLDAFLSNFNNSKREAQKLVLKTNDNIHVVNIPEIIRCEADGNYTTFYLNSGKKIVVSSSLKEYETLLASHRFFRTHQSHLINMDFLDRYDKKDGGFIVMKDGAQVPVSVRKKDTLLEEIQKL